MLYLADAVVFVHFFWILFLFFGGIWGRKSRPVRVLHIGGLALALVIQVFDLYCPLTYFEVYLRSKNNPAGTYAGSFITHYAERLIYLDLSRGVIVSGTILLCGFNLWLYAGKKKS